MRNISNINVSVFLWRRITRHNLAAVISMLVQRYSLQRARWFFIKRQRGSGCTPVLDRSYWKSNLLHSHGVFFCFPKYLFAGRKTEICESHLRPEFGTFFFSLCSGPLRVSACVVYMHVRVRVCVRARESRWETKWRERRQRREFPKLFHLLLCHRSFMAPGLDKAPDEASRKTDKSANKSGLWLFPRPSFTPFITPGAYTRACA